MLPILRERLALHSAAGLAALFEKVGLPFAPIRKPEELYDDEHLLATGGLADITLPDGKRAGQTARTALLPFTMDGQRLGVRLQPPRQGEHTADVLAGLGYTPPRSRLCSARQRWPERLAASDPPHKAATNNGGPFHAPCHLPRPTPPGIDSSGRLGCLAGRTGIRLGGA